MLTEINSKLVLFFFNKKYKEFYKFNKKIREIKSKFPLSFYTVQDDAPCHRARATKMWFENNNIDCMNWSPLSPDLNPVKNLWTDLSRMIYRDGKQYNNI